MKKLLLTAVFACLTIVSYGQEKPTEAKAHTCTEACDHSEKQEMKACCKAAKAEGKECSKCESPKKVAMKSCCSDGKKKACGDSKPAKQAKVAMAEKKSCCSEGKKQSCGSATK
jgi:hypothetical protein